ncbi:MAG TPA: response regulator transcription factor [Anaerolineales bacterium]|nr:response regulator transcription factor [Anaerolineales bacterium]
MLRILLVDDHEVVRLGIRSLLNRHANFEVVDEAADAQDAIRKALEHKPDVVVMDVRMPGMSGVEATRKLTEALPDTKVIILTSYAEDEVLFDAISAGAAGYVLKQIDSQELIRALETVGRGESLLDPSLTQKVFDRVRDASRKAVSEVFSSLTNRELKILSLISEGMTNKEIAATIYLSEKTVRNYVSSILSKLNLSSRSEASAFAVRNRVDDHLPPD